AGGRAGAGQDGGAGEVREVGLAWGGGRRGVGVGEGRSCAVIDKGLQRPPSVLGVLSSLQGVGAIAGGLTAARGMRRLGDVWVTGVGMAAFAVGDLSFVTGSLPLIGVGVIVAGFGVSWVGV